MDELEGFLSAQRGEGELDSDGEFTMSLEKARQKLRKFQLGNPAFYLLKIFQSAVRACADKIEIKLSGRTVRLWFQTEEPVYDIARILAALDTVLGCQDQGLRHLVIGINSSLAVEPEHVLWGEWGPHPRALKITDAGVETVQPPKPPCPNFGGSARVGYMFEIKRKGSLLSQSFAAEKQALESRCCYAPATVLLNGHELTNRWDSAHGSAELRALSRPFFLTERFVLDPEGQIEQSAVDLRGYENEGDLWLRHNRKKASFCLQFLDPQGWAEPEREGPLRCRAAFAVPLALTGESRIYVVKDGVVLNPVKLAYRKDRFAHLGAVALFQGDDVEVDMSEFSVKEDLTFQRFVDESYHNWGEMAAMMLPRLNQLKRCPGEYEREEKRSRWRSGAGAATGGGCLLPLLIGIVFPEIGESLFPTVVAVGALGGFAYPFRKRPPDRDEQLREYVRERLQSST